MSNEAARQREGDAHDEDNEMVAIVDEERELLLQEAISRLNAVYIVSTKEHGIESVHWTHIEAAKVRTELHRLAAYKNLKIDVTKVQVVK